MRVFLALTAATKVRFSFFVFFVFSCFSWSWRSDAQTRAADFPAPVEGDFVVRDFRFGSGETLPALNLHYRTIGTPRRDASGVVRNAVLILHGTGGTGEGFLSRTFGGELFGPGQLLDATRYFIILPDGIGHGKSSKPSNGLRARFPKYTYDDMVRAQHTLLVDGLKVDHLRLVLGTSMGAMHCWVWGEMYPDFVDGLVPLASVPTQIAGRNRVMRKMITDSITQDPDWKNGDYTQQPHKGLVGAVNLLMMMTSSPLQWHKSAPTRDAADTWYEDQIKSRVRRDRRERHAVPVQRVARLRSVAAPREDHGRRARHQLGGRRGESSGAGADGDPDAAREARPLHPDPDQRRDARPRHALAADRVGRTPRRFPERSGACGVTIGALAAVSRSAPSGLRTYVRLKADP